MPEDTKIDESSDVATDSEYDEPDTKLGNDEDMMAEGKFREGDDVENGTKIKKAKLDPKDPLRPRRKKARRACFACQRAHLTCGDERPCQRCIKRGLADACQDGVRKKAKYLHDAPPEALRPVLGPTYNPPTNGRNSGGVPKSTPASDTTPGMGGYFTQVNNSQSFPMQYQQRSSIQQSQMPPPLQTDMFISQQSPISPGFSSSINQRSSSIQGLSTPLVSGNLDMQDSSTFSAAPLFDPSNPALFNFDLEGLNFGNHYGALEFGMLNHMSSGASHTPPHDRNGSMSQRNARDGSFNAGIYNGSVSYNSMYPQDTLISTDFQLDGQNSSGTGYDVKSNQPLPRAYAIEATGTGASPSTDAHASPGSSLNFESSPTMANFSSGPNAVGLNQSKAPHNRHAKRHEKTVSKLPLGPFTGGTQRTRDSSSIYSSVTEPYSYTTGFHGLTACIQRRFSANATLKIAKSLASIRPSFISCTKTLNRQDLIFMEKCFQRTLFEYEDFMRYWVTPTVVCRRTGEVAAVNKEFTLLTGWTKNVMLGREPNLNVNTGKSSNPSTANPSAPGSGRGGLTTPRIRPMTMEKGQENRPQPIFLAELLDDDSVVEFYDDFAKLAFGDSRGSVRRSCKLLKYMTKEQVAMAEARDDPMVTPSPDSKRRSTAAGDGPAGDAATAVLDGRVSRIDGEFGIGELQRDGKLDCTYCWTVKRDVFDIPMLIVMNFLPWIN